MRANGRASQPSLLIDLSTASGSDNGTTIDASYLASALIEQAPRGIEVVLEAGDSTRESICDRIPGLRTATWRRDRPAFTPSVVLVSRQVGISHLQYLRSCHPSAAIVIRWLDFISVRRWQYAGSPAKRARQLVETVLALEAADGVAYLSDHVRDQASAISASVPPGIVVPPGLDHIRPAPTSAVPGLPASYLLAVGPAFTHKRRDLVIDCARSLRDGSHGDVGVVFVGRKLTGPGIFDSAAYARQQSVECVDLGTVTHGELATLYSGALACVYPSDEEGFGLVPFEAAAYGCPSVVTPGGALASLMPPALLTEANGAALAESVRRLTAPHERELAVELLRETAKPYTWRSSADALWSFLLEVRPSGAGAESRLPSGAPQRLRRIDWMAGGRLSSYPDR